VKEKIAIISGIMPVVIILDLITKRWALSALTGGPRIELFGGLIPLTLAFNRGAAFGLSLGNNPRWFFIPITVLALVLLIVLLTQAEARDWLRFVSVSLVISGALGNLYDRVRWNRGVVDFIGPIDLGVMHWPIFNVADMAISGGAVMLAVSFWREEQRERLSSGESGNGAVESDGGAVESDDSTLAPEPGEG